MNNELVNEINNYRSERLHRMHPNDITRHVRNAIELIATGAMAGLQGLDASEDGITRALWTQAVCSAEMDGSLTYPQFTGGEAIPADAQPVSWEIAIMVISGRVARSILVINGYAKGLAEGQDDWCYM